MAAAAIDTGTLVLALFGWVAAWLALYYVLKAAVALWVLLLPDKRKSHPKVAP